MVARFFLLQIFFAISVYCEAQPVSVKLRSRVDSLVKIEMQKQNIPGMSVAVVRNGKIDYVKGYGVANIEHNVAVKPETVFQAGSVGKQFTAFAILLLVEDGKMDLDDRLTTFFPDAPASWNSITVKHLLTHTAGFGEYPDDFNYRADYTEDSLFRIISNIPLQFAAGEKSVYSNAGYVALGLIISKVTGRFYGEFLKQRIFDPLGMTTARIISEYDLVPNRAAGYQLVDGEIKNQDWVSPSINTTADGSMYVTALDMAKWEAGLNSGRLLKKESYELMWSPVKLNDGSSFPYGFGWWVDSLQGKKIVEHNGTWQGFESTIKKYPQQKIAVIVFANLRRANTNKIATRVLELYQPELRIPRLKAIKDNEPKITALVKNFVVKLIDNKLTEDLFTPEMAQRFIPRSGRASAHLKSLGYFMRIELLDRKDLPNENRVYHYRLIFRNEPEELLITITKDNKISAIEGRE
ncbi:serine hydrolase domain-containing protein [Lacibacter sp. H407]|uniref:serine hydrolase domain-containing protein n=1 Tax=Lacibacter sp. H407 TaxID=3133423 RepID=UPI0030C4FE7C